MKSERLPVDLAGADSKGSVTREVGLYSLPPSLRLSLSPLLEVFCETVPITPGSASLI